MATVNLFPEKSIEEKIKFISSKIIQKKTILFLGAGFSANFDYILWKDLLLNIIKEIGNKIDNLKSYFRKELDNLEIMVQNGIGLPNILDNLKSLLAKNKIDGNQFFMDIYIKYFDVSKKEISNEKIEILDFINNNFDKIITTNYDNIFSWNKLENPKRYIKKWVNNIEEISNQVYPIHGSIVFRLETEQTDLLEKNNKNLDIIDTYESFIQNWMVKGFMKEFKELLNKAIDQDYTFIFLGYSFEDQFVANSLASFILEKTPAKTWENGNFYVLFNDFDKMNVKCDCCNECKLINPNLKINKYYKSFKKPILDEQLFGINYIRFTDILHSEECEDLFEVIKKFFSDIKTYVKIEDELNSIDSVINHDIFTSNKKFDINEYFKLENIDDKFNNDKELLFIIDYFSKKYELLYSDKSYKDNDISKILDKLFDWLYDNKNSLSQEIKSVLSNSKLFKKLLKWGINNKEVREWIGELI